MRKLTLAIFVLLASVLTTGCMKAVVRLNPDGSGTYEVGLNLSIQNLEEASSAGSGEPADGVSDISAAFEAGEVIVDEETGISAYVEERLENGSMWTYIVLQIPTLEAWQDVDDVAERFFPSDSGSDDVEIADPATLTTIPTITVDGSTVRVQMKVQSTVDPDADEEDDPFGVTPLINAFVQISYEIEMPGTLVEHNGQIDSLTGNPVWLIDNTSPDDLIIIVESTIDE